MKNIFGLLTLFLLGITAQSQNTLRGTVTSEKSNEPILATVYIPKLERGTVTDFDGNFEITNLPDGNYSVVYSALGFGTLSKQINLQGAQTVVEDISLADSAVEMDEVIISTPFHKLQSENVMKVERISTSELNSSGAVTLADGLSNIAGVEIITTGTGIGKPVIRGLSSNRVLTYAQGVRLENQQFGDEHGLGINEAGVESVSTLR